MDGSRRITTRNRRHLRRIPKEPVEEEGGEEDDDEDEEIVITTRTSAPSVPAPALPQAETKTPAPTSARGPGSSPARPVPASARGPGSGPTQPEATPEAPPRSPSPAPTIRRSTRNRNIPDRLELSNTGKSYAQAVIYGRGLGGGKEDASEPDVSQVRVGQSVRSGGGHKKMP